MEFSLFFFADDSTSEAVAAGSRYRLLLEAARFADSHGFSAVWTPERHFDPFGGLYPNPAVTGAAIAAVTSRVGIRAGSVIGPLHDPLRIAEEWSVVDNLSGGRAAVSFGSGWHPHDFVFDPARYADRRNVVLSTMETVRTLWRGEPVPRMNGRGEEILTRVYPPPVQRALPVWLTSAGTPETCRAAGAAGAGLLTHLVKQGVDVLAKNIVEYRSRFRPSEGGIAAPGQVTLMMHAYVGADDSVLEEAREPLRRYVANSLGLFGSAQTRGPGTGRPITPQMRERMIDVSVERYFRTVGLFGSVDRAVETVGRLRGSGVDEIACLIDFGLPADKVLEGLEHLDTVRRRINTTGAH
ncbi:MupA/Atu3671 family FMN-dependent luciferase-like monooxygenase [Amycolatopsis sp. H20-H5]|uniref:MupA/Atu3671 family FMN-dependent luciferase-like monooxygenase n=1 Tax=Amycolatopsis sp. H20-H5 TaxID=3046309 RepID=UPI002DBE08CD|nr:MupA/Atu3671 family FMN-dependent luciferase-like monooxygenase [Amycolatopsis sp. H20-H5]MEC3975529.1 MupA/Atu3671 family FMN-dependent luciferase-like monooxygenase [Amycolatopsis sp. H20-H5]